MIRAQVANEMSTRDEFPAPVLRVLHTEQRAPTIDSDLLRFRNPIAWAVSSRKRAEALPLPGALVRV